MNEIQSAVIAAFRQSESVATPPAARPALEAPSYALPGLHITVVDSLAAVETL